MTEFYLRTIREEDQQWVRSLLRDHWGSTRIVSRGTVYQADRLPGFIAWDETGPIGLVTYHTHKDSCQIVTLDSLTGGRGVGTKLIQAVKTTAREAECTRLWVITTNDNLPALRFYQKRGFELVAVYRGAVNQARKLKPQIPEMGLEGIPIRDEIELELAL